MVNTDEIKKLMNCFPNSFINYNFEFIADRDSNSYFILENCENELDVKCKCLEWLSEPAYKICPYNSDRKNDAFHVKMLNGINQYLGTSFTADEMETIYIELGNSTHHTKTIEFIETGFDFDVFEDKERDEL